VFANLINMKFVLSIKSSAFLVCGVKFSDISDDIPLGQMRYLVVFV
jgi:hypothetical protein